MHGISIFSILPLFLSFELNLSKPRLRSDKISRRIPVTTGMCRHQQLSPPGHQKQQSSLSRICEILNVGRRLINNRLKHFWLNVICCICQPNEVKRESKHGTGGL